jgi:homoserine kinase type II
MRAVDLAGLDAVVRIAEAVGGRLVWVSLTPRLLQRYWGLRGAVVHPLGGGMNSETWLVEHQEGVCVAKLVPASSVAELEAGGQIAATLSRAGFVTGPPLRALDGRLVVSEHGLALLEHVPGRELTGDTAEEQTWIAETLAGIHRVGDPSPGPAASAFMTEWLSPTLPGVEAHPWLLGAIEAVRQETGPLHVTWSVVHTDPSPEAFVHDDRTGTTGLIDWAGARRGPTLYDVASAVMYLGGPADASTFLAVYRRQGPLGDDDLQHLDAFRRLRWTIQGTYFAHRLATDDLTGILDDSANLKGLEDARRSLAVLGLHFP